MSVSTKGARPTPDMVRIRGGRALSGEIRTPGDKSISHRALIVAAMAEGRSVISGLSDGADVRHTLAAVRALGASVAEWDGKVAVRGGRGRLHVPEDPVDCGNSGTGMRLLAGLVAGLDGETVLTGDESLSARPMDRIALPLRAMGASVEGRGERCLPPISVGGGGLHGVTWTPAMASAQVKSAVLLAGVWADTPTVVREAVRTRAHTEEILALAGAGVEWHDDGAGRVVTLSPSVLAPFELAIPGDPSQAAFWIVAGTIVPGSSVVVRGVYLGRERIGFLGVLERMGADVTVALGDGGVGTITARYARLRGTTVEAAEIPSLDEVPILAVAAVAAEGATRFSDVGELRVKESDRLEAVTALVRSLGARADLEGDDLVVHGAGRLAHCRTDSGGDHRMAMAAAVGALAAGDGESRIDGFSSVATSYPTFLDDLRALGGGVRLRVVAIDGPAGSGKSTVSRALAERLGLERLDTGAMYRAVAWAALDRHVDPADAPSLAELARTAVIELGPGGVSIDGAAVTSAIRSAAVNRAVSAVAANPAVRAAMVERQRAWVAARGGGVVEGRDIGTVVLPDADLKVFLTATPEERARRRRDEAPDGVARRDHLDTTRAASPLAMADDARLIDTTGHSVSEVIEAILSWL